MEKAKTFCRKKRSVAKSMVSLMLVFAMVISNVQITPNAFPTVWAAESETSGTSEASENSSQSDEAVSDGEEAGEASENSGDDEQENSEVQKSLDSEETSTTAESTQTGESEQPEETSDGGNTEETASTAVETEDTIELAVETETATETASETETTEEESTAFLGDGDENPEEQVSIKLHFKDALNWDTDTNNIYVAYASYKKPEQDGGNGSWVTNYDGGAWPGVEISQDADEYYTLELDKKPTDDGLVFVFHNGNGTQTNDYVIPMSAFSGDTTEYWIFAAKVGNYGKHPAQICSKAIDNFNSLEIGTDRRVTFRYFDCFETSTVKLAGDMTSWGDNAIEMKDENGSGIYIATTDVLEPKEYGYKFIIGADKWITDPNNDSYTTNGNSKFTIKGEEPDKIISPEVDGNKVTFRYENKNATDVYVRGEMTDWSASDGYKMTKNEETGVNTLEVELTHGAYEYKFWYQTTENGEEKEVWLRDPNNELKTDTADPNSIVYVQGSEQYQYTIHYYNPSVDIPTQVPSEGSGPDLHIWDKCPGAAVGQEYKFTALTKDEDTEKGKTWLTTTVDVPFPHINIIARPTGAWIEGADEKEWTYEIKKDANTAELWFVYGEGLYDKNPFLETYRYTVHYYNPAAPNQETSTPDLYVWGAGSANPGKLYTFAAEKLDDTDNGIKWLTTEIDTPYEKIGLIGKPTAGNNAAGWTGKDTDRFYQLKNDAKEAELWYVHGVGIYEEKPMMKLDSVETALSLESMDYTQNSVLSLVFNGNNDSNVLIKSASVDASALGISENLTIDPQLCEVTLSVRDNIEAGTYQLSVTVEGINGTKLTTEASVTVKEKTGRDFDWDEAVIYFMVTDRFFDGDSSNNAANGAETAGENTGEVLKPQITVKYGKNTLAKDTDYIIIYDEEHTEAGETATITVRGNGTTYFGEKTTSFKITGTPLKANQLSLKGVSKAGLVYTGMPQKPEVEGIDEKYYQASYQNNTNAGTATVLITGRNGYTGTVKKTFKITAYDITNTDAKFTFNKDVEVPYAKGGSKLTDDQFGAVFKTEDVAVLNLKQGADYTLTYKNNKKADTTASVTVKGKGNFKGTIKDISFKIVQQDLSALEHTTIAADVLEKNAAKYNKVIPAITDLDGKALKNKTDFEIDAATAYTDKENNPISTTPSVGDRIKVTAKGKGNYKGTVSAEFYIIDNAMSIAKAAVTVDPQQYTGSEVTLEKNQIHVKLKINGTMTALKDSDFEIVGYSKNIKKGTAKVTIRGKYPYGGTKTVYFKIIARPLQKK